MSKPKIVRGVAARHDVKTQGALLGSWWSDPAFSAHVVRWGGIKAGDRVIDLGAGSGNLTKACLGVGAIPTAVELDGTQERRLRALPKPTTVVMGDIFAPTLDAFACPIFDVAITNPVFENNNETRFIVRALELARRCVAIISLDGLVAWGRWETGWRHLRIRQMLLAVPRLSFSADGSTGQEHTVCVEVVRRGSVRHPDEVDPIALSYFAPPRRVR